MDQTESKATGTRVLRYVICIILCFLSIIPFYILLINSTLKSSDILTGIKLVPGSQFITNFKGLLEGGAKTSGVNVLQAMLNSLIITVPATALQIYFGSLTAYAVTVYNFKAKNFAWGFIYAIMMIPQQVSIVGFIKICNLTHIYGSYLAMIIPAIAAPTTVYFMKQYMEPGLSVEIVEAARIDGCSEARIFFQMVLPMSRPIVVYTVISSFLVPWMDFVYAKMILNAGISSKYTVAIGLYKMLDKSLINSYFTQFCAGGVLVSIPISILFMIMQKFYVEGITGGAVKG